jgi:hypothetical protein
MYTGSTKLSDKEDYNKDTGSTKQGNSAIYIYDNISTNITVK